MNELILELKKQSQDIAKFIDHFLVNHQGFASRTFYAETFTLDLLIRHQLLDDENELLLLGAYRQKDKTDPQFHHEFNNYALADASALKRRKYDSFYRPLIFKGTKCTNWTLLREVVKLGQGEGSVSLIKQKLKKMQKPSGLIMDDPGVHSFQYHCFSATLMYEAYVLTKDDELKKSFVSAVNFIKNFILPNGDSLYIGRGQEQSFGYAALLYALAGHYELSGDSQSISEMQKVFAYLIKFRRPDGSYPLVLNTEENAIAKDVDLKDPQFKGWYAYNNYFDYLAFLGVYLDKAHLTLKNAGLPGELSAKVNISYRDADYRKFATVKYVAIWARPGGYWTNDLTFPLICYKKKIQTPCLGGEQFVDSLYSEGELSFPFIEHNFKKWSWRKLGLGKWIGNTLLWLSPWGVWKKKLTIRQDSILIETQLWTFFSAHDRLTLDHSTKQTSENTLISNDLKITSDRPMVFVREGLCAKGKTHTYKIEGKKNKLNIELL